MMMTTRTAARALLVQHVRRLHKPSASIVNHSSSASGSFVVGCHRTRRPVVWRASTAALHGSSSDPSQDPMASQKHADTHVLEDSEQPLASSEEHLTSNTLQDLAVSADNDLESQQSTNSMNTTTTTTTTTNDDDFWQDLEGDDQPHASTVINSFEAFKRKIKAIKSAPSAAAFRPRNHDKIQLFFGPDGSQKYLSAVDASPYVRKKVIQRIKSARAQDLDFAHAVSDMDQLADKKKHMRELRAEIDADQVCRNCGERGHIDAYCSFPRICHLCGSLNHRTELCPHQHQMTKDVEKLEQRLTQEQREELEQENARFQAQEEATRAQQDALEQANKDKQDQVASSTDENTDKPAKSRGRTKAKKAKPVDAEDVAKRTQFWDCFTEEVETYVKRTEEIQKKRAERKRLHQQQEQGDNTDDRNATPRKPYMRPGSFRNFRKNRP